MRTPVTHPASPGVIGAAELLGKRSAVDASGALRETPIEGVVFRPTRPVPHEDGHLTEVARTNWAVLSAPIVQVHVTTTLPGRIRAWGLHQRSTDRLFVVSGLVTIVVFDGRIGSPTEGRINTFTVSERSPGLLLVAPNLYHGWKNIGTTEASIINMPECLYDHQAPDALDLPWDSEAAKRIVPWIW
jgi:dTDP-4-dehydrorhamnose 3,5-epimerase